MSESYLNFYTSLPNQTALSIVSFFFLGLMRIAPIVSIAPFLGSRLPGGVKIGLAITITIVLLPQILLTSHSAIEFSPQFIGYALKEIFIGVIIGVLASIPFYFADAAGNLIDFLRGSSSLQVNDPTFTQRQTTPLGQLYFYVLIVLFFQIGGAEIFFNGLFNTYNVIPADGILSSTFFNYHNPFWQKIMGLLTVFTAIAIQLCAPSMIAILMSETFLGIANRLAQQVQIAFLGMAFKSLAGLTLLWAGWFFILKQAGHQSIVWMQELDKLIWAFKT